MEGQRGWAISSPVLQQWSPATPAPPAPLSSSAQVFTWLQGSLGPLKPKDFSLPYPWISQHPPLPSPTHTFGWSSH